MPNEIRIIREQYQGMIDILTKCPTDLFLSSACRRYFAWSNTKLRRATPTAFGKPSDAVMPGTVAHNRIQIDDESFESGTRTARLINPLAALDDIFVRADTRKVLSIGPRTEIELLHLVAVGVLLENIKAIDLISNSPWIELGDMHQLPYPDRSFDITISGWVLGYSRDPQKAIDEMVRVTRDGGLIAIGATYNSEADQIEYKDDAAKIQGRIFRRAEEFRQMLGSAVKAIHFQSEPEQDETGPVMLIARIKR